MLLIFLGGGIATPVTDTRGRANASDALLTGAVTADQALSTTQTSDQALTGAQASDE